MSPKNDFKAFSISNNANVVSQQLYEVSSELPTGFPPYTVTTHVLNKVLRQASTISSVVADFIATQSGENVLDDGDIPKLTLQLNKALEQKFITGVPNASLTQKGIVQLTNVVGDSDTLAVTQKLVKEIVNSLLGNINGRVPNNRKVNGKALSEDITISAIDVGAKRPGDIYLSAHPASDLAKGEYIANGDIYAIDSIIGRSLNNLSDAYKAAWGIKQNGDKINLPNLFVDGRGVFMRAGLNPGVIQGDTIRNITGDVGLWHDGLIARTSGAFYGVNATSQASIMKKNAPDEYAKFAYATFDASRVVPTANENRPLNVSMIPIIYLGA
ncbi:phage tail protein [Photorhabdus temperata]|uniref:Phage tail fiber n=2 Tax=Photorhabdus khanii TaxID=1004150 RepID=W3V5R0_9GAMM|nr:phage tail protein [Photorhabdus khanii]ETS31177.1 Phage tail fiber [Photorhabdus khanii NC19]MQL46698.1 phage tail protein [Photorhabdus khanii]OHV56011.1 phage tail protein [Photorhabdus temperata]